MKRAIQDHASDFAAILFLLVLSIAVAGFILTKERLRFPLIESPVIKMYAEMSTAQAFTPGQGQSVRVSGVQIGEVGKVQLLNGRADIEMEIDPQWKNLIHTDATVFARPRTALQDMFLEVNPGSKSAPIAKEGYTIPVSNSLPQVNLDEILGALDADTRAYLDMLVNSAGYGLRGKGGSELAGLLKKMLPIHRDLARLNGAVAQRGTNLRRLVNSLQRLNTALAAKQGQIVQLVDASSTVFRAFASEDSNISRAVADLPGTLRQTTATLAKVQTFATLLGPTANNLLPAARDLPSANQALTNLAIPSTPIIRNQIRPFVIAARPLVRNLRPAASNLATATPNLQKSFTVLNHLFNMLGFNPGDTINSPQHGYLWWLAWGDHNARTLFSVQDSNGSFRPLFAQVSCSTLANLTQQAGGLVAAALNLQGVQTVCQTLGLAAKDNSHASTTRGGAAGTGTSGTGTSGTGSRTNSARAGTAGAGAAAAATSSSSSSTTTTASSTATTARQAAGRLTASAPTITASGAR